jgi:hypothetical protein
MDFYPRPVRFYAVAYNSLREDFSLRNFRFSLHWLLTIVVFWYMTPCTLACSIHGNACSVLVGKPEERRLLGIPIYRWEVDITMYLEGKVREGLDSVLSFRGRVWYGGLGIR